jgi:hypothetical protein
MNSDEATIFHLTEAIKAAEPHIAALHSRIIDRGDRLAYDYLSDLVVAATEMIDYADRQDFMNIDRYERLAGIPPWPPHTSTNFTTETSLANPEREGDSDG